MDASVAASSPTIERAGAVETVDPKDRSEGDLNATRASIQLL
jgi:hypothetical protein